VSRKVDARIERTRAAVTGAFVALFFERPYDRITVGAIVARARVGRSTFYEHFVDKDDVLAATIGTHFQALAACLKRESRALPAVVRVLEHFAENGDQARRILTGSARRAVGSVLASMVEVRLEVTSASERKALAIAIADGQLGAIGAWLRGETGASAVETARVVQRIARAAAVA
jgi:AcrR family transcriptional regulator